MDQSTNCPSLGELRKRAKGEQVGFFGPDSISWAVNREKALALAGPATVLLQIAHPHVAAGVDEHSSFADEPVERLNETFDVVYRVVFGSTDEALKQVRGIRGMHAGVEGKLSEETETFSAGSHYHANRNDLLLWVHATLVIKAIDAYQTFVAPLSSKQANRLYQESKLFGQLFGIAPDAFPGSFMDFRTYYHQMLDELDVTDAARKQCRLILQGGPVYRRLARLSAAAFLPSSIRSQFNLSWTGKEQFTWRAVECFVRQLIRVLPDDLRYNRHYLKRRDTLNDNQPSRLRMLLRDASEPASLYSTFSSY